MILKNFADGEEMEKELTRSVVDRNMAADNKIALKDWDIMTAVECESRLAHYLQSTSNSN